MNNISTPEYRSFLEALLRVEGKTIEDELEFGCILGSWDGKVFTNRLHTYCGKDLYRDRNYIALLSNGDCASMSLDGIEPKDHKEVTILGQPIYAHRLLAGLGKVHGEWSMTCWGNDICKIGGGIEIEALKPIHQHPIEVITKITELLTQP